MLSESLIQEVLRVFKTVIILAEAHELRYNPGELESQGIRVIWEPIEDYTAPPLIRLHLIVKSIVESEKPVLVHCSGGRGRSGTVAVAYLVATRELGFEEALSRARSVEPGYVETREQERVLRLYSRVLRACGYGLFTKAVEVGVKYGFGRGLVHASSVLEHSAELVENLEKTLGARLPGFWERALYVSAVLHDVGVYVDEEKHREHSYSLILEHASALNTMAGEDVATPVATLARYHGGKDPVPQGLPSEGLLALAVLRVADGLDYTTDGAVRETKLSRAGGRLVLALKPRDPSVGRLIAREVKEKARLFEQVTGTPLDIVIEW